ncbi:MAG: glycosyltransferase family 4 protein [Planctomycetes bacterium]|jgi:glycosyltransferase involved in cell wall biosynthesis|nr:glycosyltransferase family 4 protein [Planctomycetota bacterium]
MRIALNGAAYDRLGSGAKARFCRLYGEAARLAPDHEFTLYAPHGVPLGPSFAGPAAGEVETPFPPGRALRRLILGPRYFARRLRMDHADLFVTDHFPVLDEPPTILTVHDLRWFSARGEDSAARRAFARLRFARLAARARTVVTVSEAMRQEVVEHLGIPRSRVHVVQNGVGEEFRRAPEEEVRAFRQRAGLPGEYLLSLGVFTPRKNLPLLLAAHARVPDGPPLVLAGRGGPEERHLRRLGGRVVFAGYVADGDLPALYSGAAAVLVPSLYEGFGLPVLEAFACGTPVLAADASALPETAGGAALLLPPRDGDAWAEGIRRVLGDSALRAKLAAAGLARAAAMSWSRAAADFLRLLLDCRSEALGAARE